MEFNGNIKKIEYNFRDKKLLISKIVFIINKIYKLFFKLVFNYLLRF